jgi:hypothetical protein
MNNRTVLRSRLLLAIALGLCLTGVARSSAAQRLDDSSRAAARKLGYSGVEAFQAGDYNTAHDVAPDSTQIHYYSVHGLSTCTAGGTGVLSTPTWTTTRTFCQLKVGKGCGTGEVCAPQTSASMATCTRLSGQQACPARLGTSMGGEPWSPSFTDERQCQCQCGFGMPSCGAAHIRVFSGAGCNGTAVDLGSCATDGNHCSLPFKPVSGQIVGGSPDGNSCPVDAFAYGDLLPDSPRTICCR